MAKTRKRRKLTVFGSIGLALIALSAWALLRKHEPVVSVQVEKVTRRSLTEIVTANGAIQPVLEVKISPEVSGEIIELPVDGLKEGQEVVSGGYRAISRDLEDGTLVRVRPPPGHQNGNQ
jgi:HlyD family secretion protein